MPPSRSSSISAENFGAFGTPTPSCSAQAWQTCCDPVTDPFVRSMITIVAIAFWQAVQYCIEGTRSLAVRRAARTIVGEQRVELERASAEVGVLVEGSEGR